MSARAVIALTTILMGIAVLIIGGRTVNIGRERSIWREIRVHAAESPDALETCSVAPPSARIADGFCRVEWESVNESELDALLDPDQEAASRAWFEHVLVHGWPDAVMAVLEAMGRKEGTGWWSERIHAVVLDPDFVRRAYARHAIAAEAAGVSRSQIARSWHDILYDLESPEGKYGRRLPEGHFRMSSRLSGWWGLERMDYEASLRQPAGD